MSKEDTAYMNLLKGVFAGTAAKVALSDAVPSTITEVVIRAKEKSCSCVATSSPKLLQLLLKQSGARLPSLDDYAGSIIIFAGVEFLVLPPVKQIVTIAYGKFLYQRFLSKFLAPEKWLLLPAFEWSIFKPEDTDTILDTFGQASYISCDIETGNPDDRIITCVGFTAVKLERNGNVIVSTVVIPFLDEYNYAVIATLLTLPQPKVFQNGKYDQVYLLRFGLVTHNYSCDTINMFHCWLSEMPKDLGFIASFMLRSWQYWKDEADTQNIEEYYRYNAKDAFATAMSWLALMQEVPDYAWENYYKEFPVVFPCLLTEMTGLVRDQEAMLKEEESFSLAMQERKKTLAVMTATPNFNPNSYKQVLQLFEVLGSGDIKSSDEKNRDKVADRHPLNKLLMKEIDKYREDAKLVGTYLKDIGPDGRSKTWNGRMLFAINPHGTDTGRLAGRPSAFWCGWSLHTIPRDRDDIQVKRGIKADEGFYLGEVDYSQNEARGTAYLSGDTKLIAVVDDPTKDFHGSNASAFFGVQYEKIVSSKFNEELQEWVHKTVDKVLRNDIGKRINHGANYNMGPQVMLDTMGIANVRRAQLLLGLPQNWAFVKVCAYLLEKFDLAYPVVRGAWYDKCINSVTSTGYLVGPTGWTRKCFGNPKANKHYLNAYVAHPPQSLAAMQLNTAYVRIFSSVALKEVQNFRLGPQIHDSVLFMYRKGREDLPFAVAECMKIPIEITDTFGVKRILTVPTDIKGGAERWSDLEPLRRAT